MEKAYAWLISNPAVKAVRLRRTAEQKSAGFPAAAGWEFSALCAEILKGVSAAKRPASTVSGNSSTEEFGLIYANRPYVSYRLKNRFYFIAIRSRPIKPSKPQYPFLL